MKKKSRNYHKKTHSTSLEKLKILNKSLDTSKEKRYITEANFIDTNTDLNSGESSHDLQVLKQSSKTEQVTNKSRSARLALKKININNDLKNNSSQSFLNDIEIKKKKELLLKKQIKCLNIYFILQFIVEIFDFICVWIFPKNFLNLFNIISLVLILILDCYMFILFYLGTKEVYRKYYKYMKKIIKLVYVILGIFFIDMIYEIVIQMLINNLIEFDSTEIFKWTIFILFYVIVNIIFPVLIIMQLTEIKKTIKQIGKLEGKDYSLSSSNYGNSNTEVHIVEQQKSE